MFFPTADPEELLVGHSGELHRGHRKLIYPKLPQQVFIHLVRAQRKTPDYKYLSFYQYDIGRLWSISVSFLCQVRTSVRRGAGANLQIGYFSYNRDWINNAAKYLLLPVRPLELLSIQPQKNQYSIP